MNLQSYFSRFELSFLPTVLSLGTKSWQKPKSWLIVHVLPYWNNFFVISCLLECKQSADYNDVNNLLTLKVKNSQRIPKDFFFKFQKNINRIDPTKFLCRLKMSGIKLQFDFELQISHLEFELLFGLVSYDFRSF